MNFVADTLAAFVMLGVIEAVVKPIAMQWTRRKITEHLPVMFEFVDKRIVDIFENDIDIDAAIRSYMENLTGDDWSKESLDLFHRHFDLRKALAHYREHKKQTSYRMG